MVLQPVRLLFRGQVFPFFSSRRDSRSAGSIKETTTQKQSLKRYTRIMQQQKRNGLEWDSKSSQILEKTGRKEDEKSVDSRYIYIQIIHYVMLYYYQPINTHEFATQDSARIHGDEVRPELVLAVSSSSSAQSDFATPSGTTGSISTRKLMTASSIWAASAT